MSFSIFSFRQIIILNELLENDDWVSLKHLSLVSHVSERTIRNDITWISNELRKYDVELESLRGKGVRVSKLDRTKVLRMIEEDSGYSLLHSRTHNILMNLLNRNDYVNLDELSDEFYISHTTMEKEIKNIDNILQAFGEDITLQRKTGNVKISGSEKNRRLLIGDILASYNKISNFDFDVYSLYFDKEDFDYIRHLIVDILSKNNLNLPDISVLALTSHIVIALYRVSEGYTLSTEDVPKMSQGNNDTTIEMKIAKKICASLEEKFDIKISEIEQQAFSYQISLKKIIPTDGLTKSEVILSTDEKYSLIVGEILSDIKREFLLDLTKDDELFIGLVYHVKTLIQRLQYKSSYFNPALDCVKEEYPFVFELAVFVRNRLQELMGVTLDENEVSFFAIHLGTSFQRQRQIDSTERVKIAVVCHTGYSNSKFLVTKLKSIYSHKISIVGVFSIFDLENINDTNIDILLSTTDIQLGNEQINVVKIDPLLSKKDIKALDKLIEKINMETDQDFINFFHRDFFYENLEVDDYMKLINYMSKDLQDKNYVYSSFCESCIQRENLSTTIIKNGIALPHPLKPLAFKSVISVAILKESIAWNEKPIRIAFMFAINRSDQKYLKGFLEFMVELMDDEVLLEDIISSANYDRFIQYIMQAY